MSLGSLGYSYSFEQAIDYAVQNNVTVVAAMGNDNSSIISYPAGYLNAIAVGSTDPNDHRSSNWYNDPTAVVIMATISMLLHQEAIFEYSAITLTAITHNQSAHHYLHLLLQGLLHFY